MKEALYATALSLVMMIVAVVSLWIVQYTNHVGQILWIGNVGGCVITLCIVWAVNHCKKG